MEIIAGTRNFIDKLSTMMIEISMGKKDRRSRLRPRSVFRSGPEIRFSRAARLLALVTRFQVSPFESAATSHEIAVGLPFWAMYFGGLFYTSTFATVVAVALGSGSHFIILAVVAPPMVVY